MSERDALIIMNQVIGLGAITVRRLEHHFGSLTQALAASVSELQAVAGIGMTRAERFCQEFRRLNARAEVARAAQKGVKLFADVLPSVLGITATPGANVGSGEPAQKPASSSNQKSGTTILIILAVVAAVMGGFFMLNRGSASK